MRYLWPDVGAGAAGSKSADVVHQPHLRLPGLTDGSPAPFVGRRRAAALEQLALRCKRRQYRPATYGGRWRRNFPEICPGARCRPP